MEEWKSSIRSSDLKVHLNNSNYIDSTDIMGAQSVTNSMVSLRGNDNRPSSSSNKRSSNQQLYSGSVNFAFRDNSRRQSRESNYSGSAFDELPTLDQCLSLGRKLLDSRREEKLKISQNASRVHDDVDRRVQMAIEHIQEYAKELHEKVDKASNREQIIIERSISDLSHVISEAQATRNELQDLLEKETDLNETDMQRLEAMKVSARLVVGSMKQNIGNSQQTSQSVIKLCPPADSATFVRGLVGILQGGLIKGASVDGSADGRVTMPPSALEEVKRFHVKSSKDSRECGITDVAVTAADRIVVVDKHNRLVKMFDMQGKFDKFVGRDRLKEPARVIVLRATDHIVVTDIGKLAVVEFDSNGNFVRNFVNDLKYPASVAETADGYLTIVDYATKTIIFYDQQVVQIRKINCAELCPAFITCSIDSKVIVSDWQNSSVTILGFSGEALATITSANGVRFKQQHGVAEDPFGNVIIADKGNHRIVVLDKDTLEAIYTYTSTKEKYAMRLPMAVAFCHTSNNQMIVVDYQGYVRVCKYSCAFEYTASGELTNSGYTNNKTPLPMTSDGTRLFTARNNINHSVLQVKPTSNQSSSGVVNQTQLIVEHQLRNRASSLTHVDETNV